MDREHRSCAVCERDNREEAPETHSRDGWILKECPDCSLVYLENPATYETLVSDHAWEKSFFAERASRRRNRRAHYLLSDGYKLFKRVVRGGGHVKLLRVLRAAAPEGRVLDVGCGFGRTLAMLGSSYTPFGVEISAEQAKQADVTATARGGWVVQASATEGVRTFDEGFFDGVIMHAFLEHENAPRELLEGVHRVLKPGAPAIIKVPNWASVNRRLRGDGWCGLRLPDHVNYFTPRTLRAIVERAGFKIERFGLRERWPLSDNMWMVARRPK